MDENTIIYLVISLFIALLVLLGASRFGAIGIIMTVLSLVTMLVILLLAFADFLIVPLFTKALNITQVPAKDYVITSGQEAVVKYTNGIYYATGYLTANIYNYVFAAERGTEDEEALVSAPDKWEKAIMNIHFPFKFNLVSASEDIQRYRDELETKRGLLEFQYSKEMQSSSPNSMGLENMQRQMNILQTSIDKIGQGEKPINNIMYIESTAVGVSLKEANDNLSNQLNELQTIFNIFDLSITRVMGRELYLLFRMNYIIPSMGELMGSFQVQK